MNANHGIIAKRFEKEMKSLIKRIQENQPTKEKPNVFGEFISKEIVVKDFSKRMMCSKKSS